MNNVSLVLYPEKNFAIGGYKVVYEYANRLSKRNWTVNIVYEL